MEQLHKFHQTKNGSIAFAVIELILFYIVASVAIDTASLWAYLVGFILLIGVILNIVKAATLQFKK